MKNYMLPRSGILRETHPESTQSPIPNPIKQRLPSSSSRKQKYSKENAPPSDQNSTQDAFLSPAGKSLAPPGKFKSLLPPRPPSSNPNNPLKRKLIMDNLLDCMNTNPVFSDSGVKVVVRMRPPLKDEEGDMIVQKVSSDSLSIQGQPFTFDSVADTGASQLDMFELIGAPLVENCLAGFNSSVFAYGQTGSGKTYTMWGPANALLEENALNDQQGLTPRVLERLFARINEEQIKHIDTQLKYQCRCSFLEIYNEQITDLLDPSQRNLQIREDVKSGVYVENLTEECICTMKGVAQILTKGLLNRRTSATSTNAESSRSHSVFTCIVESRCKSTADGLSSFKTSRINLVDLAGSERQKLSCAAGERLKEAGNINRSLSQLGNLINILAEVSQTGKQRHIPYRDSRLTFLLQESLGGNAKLAVVCAISPSQSCKSESFSTLRFAQRAKAIKNKAVVNEVMRDDVNVLREVICQLKDELLRMKSNCNNTTDPNGNYSTGWNARRSLHLLKFSLNRPTTLPHVDNDSDEEMEIVGDAVEKLCAVERNVTGVGRPAESEGIIRETSSRDTIEDTPVEDTFNDDSDINMEEATPEKHENMNIDCVNPIDTAQSLLKLKEAKDDQSISSANLNAENNSPNCATSNLSLVSGEVVISPILKSPTPSISPRVVNTSRKSLKTSSMLIGSQKDGIAPLAASLHHGLEIIENFRQDKPSRQSFRFPLNTSFNPVLPIQKVEVGVQTIPELPDEDDRAEFLCSKCKTPESQIEEINDNSNLQLVPLDVSPSMKQVPKAVEKVLAGAIRREMALEEVCTKQISEIKLLNRLVQQYKHERECNAVIGQTREDKILRLENLMDGVLPTKDFMDEELASLTNEHKLLKDKYANHPEIIETRIELKRVRNEYEQYRSFFDLGEKEVLLEEIQDLRNQLQFYIDSASSSSISAQKRRYDSRLASPLSTVPESNDEERIEERETESKWICVADDLRKEVEASRCLGEKLKRELDSEKKCSEELKEAMQMAMMGHARMLEQYADLEEKHMELLARHRKISEGMNDVKKAAQKAGVRGAESKFINALASEISALKAEREKERRYLRDEIKGLQAQLRDTAEAVQAAGELLVRLKEAEEAVAIAEEKALDAAHETEKTNKEMRKLKRKHEKEINTVKERDLAGEIVRSNNNSWKEGFGSLAEVEESKEEDGGDLVEAPSSWFSGSDQCNI